MPGKSKRKQLRYATNKQMKTAQTPSAATAAPVSKDGTVVASKPQTPAGKVSGTASKGAPAQYTPDLLKHVGTELKISVALSAFILVVIIVLAFVLH